jgi:hypothetical protein
MGEQLAGLHSQAEFVQVQRSLYRIGIRKGPAGLAFKQWIRPRQQMNNNDCGSAFIVRWFESRIKFPHKRQICSALRSVQNQIEARRSVKIEVRVPETCRYNSTESESRRLHTLEPFE